MSERLSLYPPRVSTEEYWTCFSLRAKLSWTTNFALLLFFQFVPGSFGSPLTALVTTLEIENPLKEAIYDMKGGFLSSSKGWLRLWLS
jgi:hypothetical protein